MLSMISKLSPYRLPLDQLDFSWCSVQLVHAVGVREDDGVVGLSPWQLAQLNI